MSSFLKSTTLASISCPTLNTSDGLSICSFAIRVFRALNELGITTVGVFSKEDRYALFRSKADESYQLNPDKGPIDAYLDINTIIRIAKEKNVDAIHPGYGFLSENPDFVDA